jgi:hypothetical protein
MSAAFKGKVWKKIKKGLGAIQIFEDCLEEYASQINKTKKPKSYQNHVGIEIECFSSYKQLQVAELLLLHDLEKYVQVTDDGSISPETGKRNTYEFRILSTEKQLHMVLKKLNKFFKVGKFAVNNSCGMHVHLDMRNRDMNMCYTKLLKFQHIMFGLVSSKRWNNYYCRWTKETTRPIEALMSNRFKAVNFTSYRKHRTIEIRLHEGTLDTKKIQNWVNLLLKAIGSSSLPDIQTKKDAVNWVAKDKQLKSYIKKEFNDIWLKRRSSVIRKACPPVVPGTWGD